MNLHRVVAKLSAQYEEYTLNCEQGSSRIEKINTSQEFLLFIDSVNIEHGSQTILVGKTDADEALMLEFDEANGELSWVPLVLEEPFWWTIEFSDYEEGGEDKEFRLSKNHGNAEKYLCLSPDVSLAISNSSDKAISFVVVQSLQDEIDDNSGEQDDSIDETSDYHSGILLKKGDDVVGAWKRRYFVLLKLESGIVLNYYDKEGGNQKGSIECSEYNVVLPSQEKFGLNLVPVGSTNKVSKTRIYRLKAESAESQSAWYEVLTKLCGEYTMQSEREDDENANKDCDEDFSPKLTAKTLNETERSRSRSGSAGTNLSIDMDLVTSSTSKYPLYTCSFEEGALGMTLKRRVSGVVYVATVEPESQAEAQELKPDDVLWSIGDKVIGNVCIDKKDWGELVNYIKDAPRPVEMVFQRLEEETKKEDMDSKNHNTESMAPPSRCSTSSAYSLLEVPEHNQSSSTPSGVKRSSSPCTPQSLQSLPSSVALTETVASESRSNSAVTIQSLEHSDSTPTEEPVESTNLRQHEYNEEADKKHESILAELSKHLIFKNANESNPSAAKGWRSTLLGGTNSGKASGSMKSATFELVQPGRHLVYEGSLLLLGKKALWQVKVPKVLYLFNDILLLAVSASSGSEKYIVESIIDVATCKVNSRISQSHELISGRVEANKIALMFELMHPAGSLVFLCPSREVQYKWVQILANTICERICEFNGSGGVPMGIGWRHQYHLGTMHAAVLQRDQDFIVDMLESFAAGNVDEEELEGHDGDGYTPLHYASILRLPAIVRLLQESSADVTVTDHRGLSPLHWSALQLDAESLERLCMNVMNVDIEDEKGRTPLYLACVEGRMADGRVEVASLITCVKVLLTYGANPNHKDKEGKAVLHYLSSDWQFEVIELLLDGLENPLNGQKRTLCADVNMFEDEDGWTALHLACGESSLKQSAGEGHVILQSMDPSKISENYDTDETGNSRGSCLRTLLTLLEHGALPNLTTFQGHTPLSILAQTTESSERWSDGLDAAIVMLLSYGARLSFYNVMNKNVSNEVPQHWRNSTLQTAIQEGMSVWNGKEQIDGDAANLRLKCYEHKKCANAIVTSELRQQSARLSDVSSSSYNSAACPCLLCLVPFTMFRRQHHCRLCDALCCDECSRKRVVIDKSAVRVCDACYTLANLEVQTALTEKFFSGEDKRFERDKAELFKGAKAEDPSAAKTKSIAGGTVAGTVSTLEDTKLQFKERGEKLENLADRSAKLANASSEFANMAKLLKEQNKSSWW